MSNRIMLFIPAYNCEKQIPRVLAKLNDSLQKHIQEVVIIDNRSTDNTIEAAKQAAEKLTIKTTILRNKENYNLGGSIKSAFIYAIKNHYDYMIALHGDDQADLRDLLPLLDSGEYHNQDIIIGARFHPQSTLQGYSKVRILGNKILNIMCGLINHRKVDDLIAGINCFKIDFFKNQFFMGFPNNLTFDAHVLLYAFNKKARIKYIPVTWREEDQISNAKVVKQALIIMKLFISYLFKRDKVFQANKSGRPLNFIYESEVIFKK